MKTSPKISSILLLLICLLITEINSACTTFVLRQGDRIVFGRNLDWITGTGLLITNPAGCMKRALIDPGKPAIQWVAKFGSVTFNQIGRGLPYGGMNETGLVVEHLTLEKTVYPAADHRFPISANQWIQYQLDNFSTVEQVIASDTLLRIVDATSKYHYLICDSSGNAATIEFINGKMIIHAGNDLSIPVLANSTWEESHLIFEQDMNTDANRSLYNFCTAASMVNNFNKTAASPVDAAFAVLDAVSQGPLTKWSVVYDITRMEIIFKVFETPVIAGERKIFMKEPGEAVTCHIQFNGIDFSCNHGSLVLNLNRNESGCANDDFVPYTKEVNQTFISKAFTFFADWGLEIKPDSALIEYLAGYPDTFECVEP